MKHNKHLLALVAAGLFSCASFAQTSVSLYGVMDVAVRSETNHGANKGRVVRVIPGGMSQSRLGVNVSEDLGDGWRALANLEHRLLSDSGAQASAADFWRQAWVGVITPAGRITLGRQYNVLFDAVTSTVAPYRYSPYMEVFKPELGMALGARQSNMVKYAVTAGGFTGELQVSAGEGTSNDKSVGGMVRYTAGGFAVTGGLLTAESPAGREAEAKLLGVSYTSGPLYLNFGWVTNSFDADTFVGGMPVASQSLASFGGPLFVANGTDTQPNPQWLASGRERDMWSVGGTYQITSQFNLGAQYYSLKQTGFMATGNSKVTFYSVVADYALSKRTDIYVGWDRMFADGAIAPLVNGAKSRTGVMSGVRHRF